MSAGAWCSSSLEGTESPVRHHEQHLLYKLTLGVNRAADLSMTALFNARDRTISDWKSLLSQADSRFVLKNVVEPKGSALSILEVSWEP
jgi:hypothetical protein